MAWGSVLAAVARAVVQGSQNRSLLKHGLVREKGVRQMVRKGSSTSRSMDQFTLPQAIKNCFQFCLIFHVK